MLLQIGGRRQPLPTTLPKRLPPDLRNWPVPLVRKGSTQWQQLPLAPLPWQLPSVPPQWQQLPSVSPQWQQLPSVPPQWQLPPDPQRWSRPSEPEVGQAAEGPPWAKQEVWDQYTGTLDHVGTDVPVPYGRWPQRTRTREGAPAELADLIF